jgi:hypothetical protein
MVPRGGLEPQGSEQQKSFAERAFELFSSELEPERSCGEMHEKQGKNKLPDKSVANLAGTGTSPSRSKMMEHPAERPHEKKETDMKTLPDGDRLLLLLEVAEASPGTPSHGRERPASARAGGAEPREDYLDRRASI